MGPRLQERGVNRLTLFFRINPKASMGPRLQERGVLTLRLPRQQPQKSFNGAALTRARSYVIRNSYLLRVYRLQWGRAYKSAELRPPRNGTLGLRSSRLQWGRAYKSAEFPGDAREAGVKRPASMGPRLQERGVRSTRSTIRGKEVRFNGAALTRARSLLSGNTPFLSNSMLQWGRAYKSAELIARESLRPLPALASMGPRLQERGVRRTRRRSRLPLSCFNGAALTRARSSIREKPVGMRSGASMGPRLQERGVDFVCARATSGDWSLQWGRAYKSAELAASSRREA